MLLSAYALLLLHDFVPHSHHEHHDNSSLATHAEHEPHQHEHDHHHHGEEEEGTPESSENNGPGVHLTSFHSHSGFEAHHHNLAYRAASKDELVVQVVETALLTSYSGQPKEPSDRSSKYFDHFKSSFSNPLLFSSIGLRAPPALG